MNVLFALFRPVPTCFADENDKVSRDGGAARCVAVRCIACRYVSKGRNAKTKKCLNLGSYNYLGFADDWNTTCRESVFEAFEDYSVSSCSPRLDCGAQ